MKTPLRLVTFAGSVLICAGGLFAQTPPTSISPPIVGTPAPVTPNNATSFIAAAVEGAVAANPNAPTPPTLVSVGSVSIPTNPPQAIALPPANARPSATDLLQQFQAAAKAVVAQRQDSIEKLKTASSVERTRILEQLRAQEQSRTEEQRAMARQIRDEIKKLRDQVRTGG